MQMLLLQVHVIKLMRFGHTFDIIMVLSLLIFNENSNDAEEYLSDSIPEPFGPYSNEILTF